jgi:hypothetical protein
VDAGLEEDEQADVSVVTDQATMSPQVAAAHGEQGTLIRLLRESCALTPHCFAGSDHSALSLPQVNVEGMDLLR